MAARCIWLVCLLLVATTRLGAEEPQGKVPKEVKQAEQTLTKWIGGFKDKTSEEVRKSLGDPTQESSWLFEEKKELLLKYKIGDSTELSLYFFKERVVKVSFHILP